MNFQKIEIINYGNIENFNYTFRKNELGNPVPLVLIGKNGSGKTLLISNLIDCLVELKRKIYPNGIQEVNSNNYYKIGSLKYIKKGENTSKVYIDISINEKIANYIDIMSIYPEKALKENEVLVKELDSEEEFKDTRFSKKINIKDVNIKDFEKGVLLYFPSDKFYQPMWYNSENYNRINYDINTFVRKSRTNFIKIDLLDNINDWLNYVYLDKEYIYKEEPSNVEIIPSADIGIVTMSTIERRLTKMQQLINKIINIIKDDTCTVTFPTRKNRDIQIKGKNFYISSISQLSTGEMFLLAISISILKEWDIDHDEFELEDIEGCVIIDEIDVSLHIDYCYKILPKLMKLFPKVQFIITTHSPFLLSGLKREYGNDIDIINMPSGEKMNDINAFNEMARAYDILELETNNIIEKNKELEEENNRLKKLNNKIIIYTEGKTDVEYLKLALNRLDGYDEIKEKIEFFDIKNYQNTGDAELSKTFEYLQKGCDSNIKICIFDRDNKSYIIDDAYIRGNNNVYKFNIPIPKHRNKNDFISIEHYLQDEELKTEDKDGRRMFLANEFNEFGLNKINNKLMCKYILDNIEKINFNPLLIIDGSNTKKVYHIDKDKTKNYALSKDKFVENIKENVPNFDKFDFSEFAKIFDVIKKIEQECNKPK